MLVGDPSYMVSYTSGGGSTSIPLSMYQQPLEKPDDAIDPEHVSGDLGYYDSRRHPGSYTPPNYFDPLIGGLGEGKLSDSYPSSEPMPLERVDLAKATHSQKRSRISCLENPKRIRSAYNYFSQDYYNERMNESVSKETIREMAEKWHNLPEEERQKYQQRNDEDRKRYEREVKRIKEFFQSYNIPPMLFKRGSDAFSLPRRATGVSLQHGGGSERGGAGELPGGDAREGDAALSRSTEISRSRWPSWRASSRRCSSDRTRSSRRRRRRARAR